MRDGRAEILVVGSGLCGLAIAVTAARRGYSVRCVGDGRPGASLANFGQLHSGAVYAPVLPEVAQACWLHRDRWRELAQPALVGEPYGYALFGTADAIDGYRDAWQRMGIDVEEVAPGGSRTMTAYPPPVAAFRILDLSVDLEILHAGITALALASGVPTPQRQDTILHRDPDSTVVTVSPSSASPDLVVVATGADTPTLLTRAAIEHTLRTRRIAWGRYTGPRPPCLTYWLDGDLLGFSPDRDATRVGLPGVNGGYGTSEMEVARLRSALDRHRIRPPDGELTLEWGMVCEPTSHQVDPSSLVVDLRDPPPGWSRATNLIVALPGKWTTAWHCADRVVDALT